MTRKKIICILLAALPLLPGCVKNILDSAAPGTQINFAASTSYDNNPGTKTEYSGVFTNETVSGVTHKYERINWVSGDKIRIYSPQAAQQGNAGVHDADYDIQASSISNSGRNSSARISSTSNTGGLVWGEGSSNYNFYALYPSPATTGIQTGVSMNGSTVTAPIPQYQRMVGTAPREVNDPTTTSGKRLVYDPDMNYAYMYAAAAATNGGTVDLRFRPLMTAFEITLGTKDPNGMEIREIYLSSNSSNHPSDPSLSGTFNATINAGNTFTLNNVTGGSSTIYADLPEFVAGNTVTVQYGRPITFTLFALPKDLTNMAIKIRLANGTTRDYEFRQTSVSGPFVVFPACRKVRITNLNAPQAETWTYTIDPIDPITLYGHLAGAENFEVKSYKTSNLGASAAVPWTIQYSTDGTNWVDPSNWSDNRFRVATTSGSGSTTTPESNTAQILRDHNGSEKESYGSIDAEEAAIAVLRGRASLPSTTSDAGDGYFDLSKHDFYVSIDNSTDLVDRAEGVQETANCYVITRPGKYKLPLVYGNGIRNGVVNSRAYAPQGTSVHNNASVNYYLYRFLNHLGNEISDPWLHNNSGVSVSNAVVVWQDVSGSSTQILLDSDISVANHYIYFEIKPENIRPGNIVLAARDAGNTIVWSWHLWVTEKALGTHAVLDKMGQTNQMMTYNLGWTDKREAYGEHWLDWHFYVKVKQPEAGGTEQVFDVYQYGESISIAPNVGSNTFYQWGRKDPILPAASSDRNKSWYSNAGYVVTESDYKVVTVQNSSGGIQESIKNPHKIFYSRPNYLYFGSKYYGNLWDVDMIANNAATGGNAATNVRRLPVKSVYDPSPRGFVVPWAYAFTSFSSLGPTDNSAPGTPQGSPATDGYNFSDGLGGQIYFPYSGARGGDGVNPIYDVTATMYYWTTGKLPSDDRWGAAPKSKNLSFWKPNEIRAFNDQYSEGAYAVRPVQEVSPLPTGPSALPQSSRLPAPSAATEQGW